MVQVVCIVLEMVEVVVVDGIEQIIGIEINFDLFMVYWNGKIYFGIE